MIEKVLLEYPRIHTLVYNRAFREALALCLNSAWQRIEAGRPGSWEEDLPAVMITAGPRCGFFLEEVLSVAGVPEEHRCDLYIEPPLALRAWPHMVESTTRLGKSDILFRAPSASTCGAKS